ncbi:hypothetical protein ACIQMR_25035 [Streptomyces sp. NPDC091376]|uniref:hypothetical protein n=1 Tax=Streptomyces sp. NPDC091376 TaxID=3365994 RepID=UPI00380C5271
MVPHGTHRWARAVVCAALAGALASCAPDPAPDPARRQADAGRGRSVEPDAPRQAPSGRPGASVSAPPAASASPPTPAGSRAPSRSARPEGRTPSRVAEPSTPARTAGPAGPSRAAAPSTAKPSARESRTPRVPAYDPKETVLHIGAWSRPLVRGGQQEVDACRAAVLFDGPEPGRENGFELDTSVIVGHDFCGFDLFADLPVGTDVRITGPKGELRYRVYATYVTPGQGGSNSGLYWGDITLQSCLGPDTGFSYLERVSPAREP